MGPMISGSGSPSGTLRQAAPAFVELLLQLKDQGISASPNIRFVPRNFLLDESISTARLNKYERSCCSRVVTFDDWANQHEAYLVDSVFLPQPAAYSGRVLKTTDETICPDTFRDGEPLQTFSESDDSLYLLRVERVDAIARDLGESEAEVARLFAECISRPELQPDVNAVLSLWSNRKDLRPVFACLWEDVRDIVELAVDGWANDLRDRLGLYHLRPRGKAGVPVCLFRYPIKAVSRLASDPTKRALAVPTVLDSRFSEAFCPAPRHERAVGFTIDLAAQLLNTREVLHPFLRFRAEHVYRFGYVDRPVPHRLDDARFAHLLSVRECCSRPDYALDTDGDLG